MNLGHRDLADLNCNKSLQQALLDSSPNLSEAEFDVHFERGSLCFVFVGITGSGKTTIARRMAADSRVYFVDVDEVILQRVLNNGVLHAAVVAFADGLENAADSKLIQRILQQGEMPEQHRQRLMAIPQGALLVSALSALCKQSIVDLTPLTFLNLSPQGKDIYSQLEEQLTLHCIVKQSLTIKHPATQKNTFTIVATSGSLSTLSGVALSAARNASIFVHFKSDASDLQSSLAQAANKPMVLEQGRGLEDTLQLREGFYRQLSHVSISRKKMWQLQNASEFMAKVRECLYPKNNFTELV